MVLLVGMTVFFEEGIAPLIYNLKRLLIFYLDFFNGTEVKLQGRIQVVR